MVAYRPERNGRGGRWFRIERSLRSPGAPGRRLALGSERCVGVTDGRALALRPNWRSSEIGSYRYSADRLTSSPFFLIQLLLGLPWWQIHCLDGRRSIRFKRERSQSGISVD